MAFFALTAITIGSLCLQSSVASVSQVNDLFPEEIRIVNARQKSAVRSCTASLTGVDTARPPTVAVAGSGGGLRAFLATWGAFEELDDAGLLDCVTYTSSVSGSTWAVGGLAYRGLESGSAQYPKGFTNLGLSLREVISLVVSLIELGAHGGHVTLVDIWGYIMTNNFVMKGIPNGGAVPVHQPLPGVLSGAIPFPIFATAQVNGSEPSAEYHHFMEATPVWFGSQDFSAWTPMTEFCGNGSVCTLSTILGTSSSFFERTEFVAKFMGPMVDSALESFSHLLPPHIGAYLRGLQRRTNVYRRGSRSRGAAFAQARPDPKRFRNYMQRLTKTGGGAPFPTTDTITCVDQGMVQNNALPSLMLPSRAVDVIINLDQYGFLVPGRPDYMGYLRSAASYAKANGYPFPPINITGLNTRPCTVFQAPKSSSGTATPIVVYMPLVNFSAPTVPLSLRFGTKLGQYTAEGNTELIALARANLRACLPQIRDAIRSKAGAA